MMRLMNTTATCLLLILVVMTTHVSGVDARVVLTPGGSHYQRGLSSHEFILEGGLAEPMGDQQDELYLVSTDPEASKLGLGQGTGYELGVRFRQYMGEFFAVSPAFHYIRFGSASGVLDDGEYEGLAYDVRSSMYKYGIDFHAFMGGEHSSFRPYLTGGIALAHNIYRDEVQYNGVFKTSVNTPAYSAGIGFKMKNIELVGEYTYNRFDSSSLPPLDGQNTYNWDYFIVRAAFSFGR